MKNYKTIFVRAPNWIGDQVLAYPFFYYLRQAHPGAKIISACVPWVADLQFRNLVDEVFILQKPLGEPGFVGSLRHLSDEARRIVQKHGAADFGISLPNSFSAAWLMYRAKVKTRRGYRAEGRSILLNEGLRWDPDPLIHRAQSYLNLLPSEARPSKRAVEFWGVIPENELDPRIPGELPAFDAFTSWPKAEPEVPPSQKYWVLAPGATAESRRWPLDRFLELAEKVIKKTGWIGVIVGGPSESVMAAEIAKVSKGKLLDYTARGRVSNLYRVFQEAQFTVCNESGLAHLASLCGSFVQIVCGAADPRRTRPIGPGQVQVAVNPVDCWPCERNVCFQVAERHNQCLKGISSETLFEEILRGTGRSTV